MHYESRSNEHAIACPLLTTYPARQLNTHGGSSVAQSNQCDLVQRGKPTLCTANTKPSGRIMNRGCMASQLGGGERARGVKLTGLVEGKATKNDDSNSPIGEIYS